jgi:hypothetical protein
MHEVPAPTAAWQPNPPPAGAHARSARRPSRGRRFALGALAFLIVLPSLLDSRPEDAVLAFLHDYIAVAGTYPCARDLAPMGGPDAARVLPLCCPTRTAATRAIKGDLLSGERRQDT